MRLLNILKENNIIKVSPEDHLAYALAKLSTSHDAAFVFDQTDKFIGVINPYYCLIKSSYPGNTKVAHCLYHPPRIYINYPLTKVAELFNQSKIHYLPVFDQQEKFLGIISTRRVLTHIKTLPIFKIKIKEMIKFKKPPVTIYDNSSVAEALSLFKTYKFSKLIVTNHERKLKGVLSYYDLISFMVMPKTKEKRGERKGNKAHLVNQTIKYFYKTYVLTLDENKNLYEVIDLIINKKIGSVAIIDKEKRPLNIITTQDLLKFYIKEEKGGFFKQVSSGIGKLLAKKKT